ncbi:hypothetical protein [Glutamicibacter ardleyensis]|uniref:hypothetical protein n=1 Tax=Glutamicibacter ardleyensis TaxID=225894 RepID=UPI003FCEEED8
MTAVPDEKFEARSVKTVRGMEARTRAKLEKEGWEFVSQTQGTIRSELFFRRPKPEIPWKLLGVGGALLAVLIIVGFIINAVGGGDSSSNVAETIPSPTPSPIESLEEITPSVAPTPATPLVAAITVDSLLDKLNSPQASGIKTGDQFQLTGELFMSELWMTGATGDFFVMLKAQGGAQDLSVFVDESDAVGWHDGTRVKMTVEIVEATINGETTDGWTRATSVQTVP